jgi:hypothetical protein
MLASGHHDIQMNFVGRDEIMNKVVEKIQHNFNILADRTSVVLVHGAPGSGKTRFLLEVGNRFRAQNDQLVVLSVTFNHDHSLTDFDRKIFKSGHAHWHLPICFRLLHAYAFRNHKNFVDFFTWYEAVEELLAGVDDVGFSNLSVLSVIDFLRCQLSVDKFPVLCLVDEVLMPQNRFGVNSTRAIMRDFYSIQGKTNNVAVVFSTLSHFGDPNHLISPAERNEFKYQLRDLEQMPASQLLDQFFDRHVEFTKSFQLPQSQLVARVLANVSALPRALESALSTMHTIAVQRNYKSLRLILESVAGELAERYPLIPQFNNVLLMCALLGVPVSDSAVEAAEFVYRRGFASSFVTETKLLELNPVQLVSYSTNYPKLSSVLDMYIANDLRRIVNAPNLNRNVFEEMHHSQLHLRCHYHFLAAASAIQSTPVTVFELFPGLRILNGSCELLNERIDFKLDIKPLIFLFASLPSPQQLSESFGHLLCIPHDVRYPGIDAILFLRLQTRGTRSSAGKAWLVVGIQDKWSTSERQRVDMAQLASSEQIFRCMMCRRGWPVESLLFVAVQRQDLPDYLIAQAESFEKFKFKSQVNNMVVIANNTDQSIKSYLGSSIFGLVEQFYLAPYSCNYADLGSILSLRSFDLNQASSSSSLEFDDNILSTEKSFQLESLKMVSEVYSANCKAIAACHAMQTINASDVVVSSARMKAMNNLIGRCQQFYSGERVIDWNDHGMLDSFVAECNSLAASVRDFIDSVAASCAVNEALALKMSKLSLQLKPSS